MSTAADLRFYYPSKDMTTDGDTLPSRVVSAQVVGFEKRKFQTALTDANGYWDGAILRWTVGSNAGEYSHVKTYLITNGEFEVYKDLPNDIIATDEFEVILGGNYRSDAEIDGLTHAGDGTNITGVTINYAGYENGEGNGTLTYTNATTELQWTAPTGVIGPAVDISLDGTYTIFDDNDSKWVTVDVVAASLPVSDQTDTVALTVPNGIFVPDFEGEETLAGKTRYRLLVPRNVNATDKLFDVRVYLEKSVATAADTTVATGSGGIGTSIDTLVGTDFTNWPTSGWVYNPDKDDIRYFYNRSGNNVRVYERTGSLRDKTASSWSEGDTLQLYPEFDIGLEAPVSDQFDSPVDEITAPSGVTFATPTILDNALSIGTINALSNYGIWIRETAVEATRARPNVISYIKFKLDISGV